jgi:hypothetical protein
MEEVEQLASDSHGDRVIAGEPRAQARDTVIGDEWAKRHESPLVPLEYRGRDSVAGFFAFVFGLTQGFRLLPTRANGQPAFGVYLHTPAGILGVGLFVLTLAGDRIGAFTRFEDTVLAAFGLPPCLPGSGALE